MNWKLLKLDVSISLFKDFSFRNWRIFFQFLLLFSELYRINLEDFSQFSLQNFCFLLGPEVRSQHFFYSSRSWREGDSIFLALKVLYYCTYLKCRPLLEYQRRSFWLECLYRPGGGHRILVAIQNDNRACIQIEETSDRQKQQITWKEDNVGSIQTSPQSVSLHHDQILTPIKL